MNEARWQPPDVDVVIVNGSSSKIYRTVLEEQGLERRLLATSPRGACERDEVDASATRRRFVDAAGRRDMSWTAERQILLTVEPTSISSGLRVAEGHHRAGHDFAEARARAFDGPGGF